MELLTKYLNLIHAVFFKIQIKLLTFSLTNSKKFNVESSIQLNFLNNYNWD